MYLEYSHLHHPLVGCGSTLPLFSMEQNNERFCTWTHLLQTTVLTDVNK
jgi:hypothetical protein